jgi:hypothetical protein
MQLCRSKSCLAKCSATVQCSRWIIALLSLAATSRLRFIGPLQDEILCLLHRIASSFELATLDFGSFQPSPPDVQGRNRADRFTATIVHQKGYSPNENVQQFSDLT